jgi:hypothetical protein
MLRSRVASTAALSIAAAAVIVMAITSSGFPVNHVTANDGGVWLTNDNPGSGFRGTFGELDVPAGQLAYAFGDPGSAPRPTYDLGVLQHGSTVLAIDRGAGIVYPVNSMTGKPETTAGATFPVGSRLAMGGGVAAVLQPASGGAPARLWAAAVGAGPVASVDGLDTAKVKPVLTVPGGSAVAVDDAGNVDVATPSSLVTVPYAGGVFGHARTHPYGTTLGSVALTTVGTVPVVLDATTRTVLLPLSRRTVAIPYADGSHNLVLQQPGPADPSVLVASDSSLLSVPLATGPVSSDTSVPTGNAAAPVRLDGCAYGAWAGGQPQAAQVCPGGRQAVGPLPGAGGRGATLTRPVFRVNHNEIVLNDTATGAAWTFVGSTSQVLTTQDWLSVLQGSQPDRAGSHTGRASATANQQHKPHLDNPTLYARPGHQSVLHLLDHDTDPGGSILSIVGVSPASGPGFSVHVTPDTEAVVLTLQSGATAPITLSYQVVDGFGLTATGPVTVVPSTAEQPPVAPPPPPARPVASGATVHLQVLGTWRDPQNDALSLADASVPSGAGQVSWTSNGSITFDAPNVPSDTPTTISYQVTNGRTAPVTGTIPLVVLGRGDTTASPPTGVPDALKVRVGQPAVFAPLANDIFGADPNDPGASLTLAGPVASTSGLTVATTMTAGTVTLTAARPGVYSLQYEAAYGSAVSAPTQILVQAVAPSGSAQPPVTSPQVVLLHGQYPATVDVLAGDYDPSGGLLTVVGTSAPTGLQATVVQGKYLRIDALTADPATHQVVTYQVTDGETDPVTGQVDVLWQPAMAPLPPVVPTLYATVRAGDEVNVPVLASASDPDGEPVHLLVGGAPRSVAVGPGVAGAPYPGGLGSASVSGGEVRYAAPPEAGIAAPETVLVTYVVESQLGEQTSGQIAVTVTPNDPSSVTAPQPVEVDARVTAGGTVTIPVPTTGVDPDGSSVTLTGITSAPQLGQVLSFTTDSITYQAFPFSPGSGAFTGGTDQFTYEVEGPTGLTGQGIIRVGVTPPAQPQPPLAVDHVVTAAPRSTVLVNLLTGDVITPGDRVSVEPLAKTNPTIPAGTRLTGPNGTMLQARAPSGATPLSIAYAVTDGTAAPSVAHVLVRAEAGYVAPPVAADYYPPAPAPGAKAITVNVLRRDSDPGGRPGDLAVVGSPVPGVHVDGADLVIPVGPDPHAVPYVVRSRSTGATAVGVVHALGTDTGPQLTDHGVIHVPRDGSTTVDIGTYVTEPGHRIRLTTTSGVSAAPPGALSETVDSNTQVTLTGLSGYQGPASLTVQVVDAAVLSAPGARTATVSIPVVVGNPTPVVRCPAAPVTVVEGGPTVDVPITGVCQVWTPDGTNPVSVTFTATWSKTAPHVALGWAPGQSGHVLALTAASDATGSATGTVAIGVPGGGRSSGSVLSVDVVAAPPPTATPVFPPPVQTGHTATIDMAQYVSSPLTNPDVYVVSVTQTSGATVPATFSGSVIRISPGTGTHGTLTYVTAVSDAGPGRPDRVVDDTITLQVLDVPSAPAGLQGVPGNSQVALSWTASAANGAPVLHYVVSMGGTSRQTAGTTYTWTGLTNGQAYTFTVTAVNQVGSSVPSAPAAFTPRGAPSAPAAVTATTKGAPQGTADITWTAAAPNGSPITGYSVYVSPAPSGTSSQVVTGTRTSLTWTGLDDSIGPYTFTVVAHNAVGSSPVSSPSDAVYAHGVPATPSPPTASGQVSTDQTTTTVVVSWPAIADCNDAQPCASYVVTELKNGTPVTTDVGTSPCATGSDLCATFGPIANDGSTYTYTLRAANQEGQTSSASAASAPAVRAVGSPATITDLAATPANGAIDVTFTVPAPHAASITEVEYTATGGGGTLTGAWSDPGSPGQRVSETVPGAVNGITYSLTVSACNEADKCGAASNAVTADPFGPPYAPTVTATGGANEITFSWSGGGNDGRAVANYELCITSSSGGSPTCTSEGANPGSVTESFACSGKSGPTYTATAYVTDVVGQQSSASAPATAKTDECAPPGAPSVSARASGTSITWSWSGGGGSGLPVANYVLCVDGSCSNVGSSPGSSSRTYACGQTHSAYAYVVDTAGQKSGNSATATATTAACVSPVSQSISIGWGPNAAPAGNWLSVTWNGFPIGRYTYTCVEGGQASSYSVYIPNETSYTATSNTCFDADSQQSVYVTTNGVASNTISGD